MTATELAELRRQKRDLEEQIEIETLRRTIKELKRQAKQLAEEAEKRDDLGRGGTVRGWPDWMPPLPPLPPVARFEDIFYVGPRAS